MASTARCTSGIDASDEGKDTVGRQGTGGGARRGQGIGNPPADEVMELRLHAAGLTGGSMPVLTVGVKMEIPADIYVSPNGNQNVNPGLYPSFDYRFPRWPVTRWRAPRDFEAERHSFGGVIPALWSYENGGRRY